MEIVSEVLIRFLTEMAQDLKRRSFDESGEQKMETLDRAAQLTALAKELKGRKNE